MGGNKLIFCLALLWESYGALAQRTARTSKSLAQIWERAYDCFGSLIGWRVWLKRFKELPNENQEQVLFFVSTLFGTITFLVLFECLYRINLYNLEQTDLVFSVSYTEAYFISILWQHILNRWLVASLAISPFWSSLLQTYFVYSLSLAMMACSGAVMIRLFGVSPRIVTMFTLPTSGVLNFYFLRFVTSKESRDVPDDTLV